MKTIPTLLALAATVGMPLTSCSPDAPEYTGCWRTQVTSRIVSDATANIVDFIDLTPDGTFKVTTNALILGTSPQGRDTTYTATAKTNGTYDVNGTTITLTADTTQTKSDITDPQTAATINRRLNEEYNTTWSDVKRNKNLLTFTANGHPQNLRLITANTD